MPLSYKAMEHTTTLTTDASTDQAAKVITGVVERLTYQNEENGYTVARFLPDAQHRVPGASNGGRRKEPDHLITVVGTLASVVAGEALELTGFWQRHAQHGWQF